MVAPIVLAGALAGGGALLGGIGNIMAGQSAAKEQSKMRQFMERVYNEYISNPLYTGARDFTLELLKGGDYNNIYYNAYQEQLSRNRANLLNADRSAQEAAARGGFLRSGQQQDLLGRAREGAFVSDRLAGQGYGQNLFNAKVQGAQMAESLAKGPFQAGMQVAQGGYNPQLAGQTSPWATIGQLGGQAANLGAMLYGQQNQFNNLSDLFNTTPNMSQTNNWFDTMQGVGTRYPQGRLI